MKRLTPSFSLLVLLLLIATSCTTPRPARKLRAVVLSYNDGARDTIITTHRYKTGKVVYVHECSCEAIVKRFYR